MNWAAVKSVMIPEGDVKSVAIGGVTVWEKPSQIPYVTDGLVGWWDGIWNAGIGTHDSTARTWKNLVTAASQTLPNAMSFSENALTSTTHGTSGILTDVSSDSVMCIEVATNLSSISTLTFLAFGRARNAIIPYSAGDTVLTNNSVGISGYGTGKHALSVNYSSSVAKSATLDGQAVSLETSTRNISSTNFGAMVRIGGRASTANAIIGSLFVVRLYNRQLTDAEVAANYAADKSRFDLP